MDKKFNEDQAYENYTAMQNAEFSNIVEANMPSRDYKNSEMYDRIE